jgi:hypothetical protein
MDKTLQVLTALKDYLNGRPEPVITFKQVRTLNIAWAIMLKFEEVSDFFQVQQRLVEICWRGFTDQIANCIQAKDEDSRRKLLDLAEKPKFTLKTGVDGWNDCASTQTENNSKWTDSSKSDLISPYQNFNMAQKSAAQKEKTGNIILLTWK